MTTKTVITILASFCYTFDRTPSSIPSIKYSAFNFDLLLLTISYALVLCTVCVRVDRDICIKGTHKTYYHRFKLETSYTYSFKASRCQPGIATFCVSCSSLIVNKIMSAISAWYGFCTHLTWLDRTLLSTSVRLSNACIMTKRKHLQRKKFNYDYM